MPTEGTTTNPPKQPKRKVTLRRVTFSLDIPKANSVIVVGDFNDWQTNGHTLKRNKQGVWTTTLNLPPGTYQYRFLVDGEWCDDPNCAVRMDNPYGSQNNAIVVE